MEGELSPIRHSSFLMVGVDATIDSEKFHHNADWAGTGPPGR